jgi:hypothetical protein
MRSEQKFQKNLIQFPFSFPSAQLRRSSLESFSKAGRVKTRVMDLITGNSKVCRFFLSDSELVSQGKSAHTRCWWLTSLPAFSIRISNQFHRTNWFENLQKECDFCARRACEFLEKELKCISHKKMLKTTRTLEIDVSSWQAMSISNTKYMTRCIGIETFLLFGYEVTGNFLRKLRKTPRNFWNSEKLK